MNGQPVNPSNGQPGLIKQGTTSPNMLQNSNVSVPDNQRPAGPISSPNQMVGSPAQQLNVSQGPNKLTPQGNLNLTSSQIQPGVQNNLVPVNSSQNLAQSGPIPQNPTIPQRNNSIVPVQNGNTLVQPTLAQSQGPQQPNMQRSPNPNVPNKTGSPFYAHPVSAEDVKRYYQGNRVTYDPRFNDMFELEAVNHTQVIRIRRSFWYGFNRGDYHPSMSKYRMLYNEFNMIMRKIDSLTDEFRTIRVLYVLIITFILCSIIVFLIGLSLQPSYKLDLDKMLIEKHVSAMFMIIALCILIFSLIFYIPLIFFYLKRYQRILKGEFKIGEFQSYERKNIYFKIGKLCNHLDIKFVPISNYQMWLSQNYVPNDLERHDKDEIPNSNNMGQSLIKKPTTDGKPMAPIVARKKKYLCF